MSQSHPPRRGGPKSGPRRRSSSAPSPRKSDPSIAPLQPTLEPPDIKSFTEWKLGDEIQGAIAGMGITTPTPIQRLAIQHVLDGRDVIAKAETGTGKTLAFGAGMMSKIDPQRASVLALVLCPTRELAEQGQKVLEILGKPRGIKVALVVGGEPLEPQVAALKGGAQVVVGTPGRILDLYKQRFLSFPWTEFAVLDEADVMLEIGFIDDVKMILSYMPDERQTLLFSATFPPELLKLAREYTKNPVEIATASGVSTVDTITQSWIPVDDDERPLALIRLIEQSADDDVFLVFCDRRTEVDRLMRRLERLPFSIKALHGGYDQAARFRVMSAFRTGEVKVLVATDVASRGLDVVHVTTVLNYSSPQDITDYTHRIGRTGRAGRKGRAITLVGGMDMRRWRPIQTEATWDIPQAAIPSSTRMGPRRDERRDAPRDARRDEPRNERETTPRGRSRSGQPEFERESRVERGPAQHGRSRSGEPEFERGPRNESAPHRSSTPAAATRWPEDRDAHDGAVSHGDVRPNRESTRLPDRERRPRSAPVRAESGIDARREPIEAPRSGRPRSEAPRTRREEFDAPPPARRNQAPAPTRGDEVHRPSREPRDVETRRPAARRAAAPADLDAARPRAPADSRRQPTGAPRRSEAQPPRAPRAGATPGDRPSDAGSARDFHSFEPTRRADADRARRADASPARAEQPRRGERPERAARPATRAADRADGGPSPARSLPTKTDRPSTRSSDRPSPRRAAPAPRREARPAVKPPALEERPPGTFERPMTGGLLGHAARRAPPARTNEGESRRRPQGGRGR